MLIQEVRCPNFRIEEVIVVAEVNWFQIFIGTADIIADCSILQISKQAKLINWAIVDFEIGIEVIFVSFAIIIMISIAQTYREFRPDYLSEMLASILIVSPAKREVYIRLRLIIESISKSVKIIIQPTAANEVSTIF
ncbi:hypothetical protein D3C86_1723720 [compost metagenome]